MKQLSIVWVLMCCAGVFIFSSMILPRGSHEDNLVYQALFEEEIPMAFDNWKSEVLRDGETSCSGLSSWKDKSKDTLLSMLDYDLIIDNIYLVVNDEMPKDTVVVEKNEYTIQDQYLKSTYGTAYEQYYSKETKGMVLKTFSDAINFDNRRFHLRTQPVGKIYGIFANGFWPEFYTQYPRAIGNFRLTHVFYNDQKNRAIVGYSIMSGGLNGYGGLMGLKKVNSEWMMDIKIITWVS